MKMKTRRAGREQIEGKGEEEEEEGRWWW